MEEHSSSFAEEHSGSTFVEHDRSTKKEPGSLAIKEQISSPTEKADRLIFRVPAYRALRLPLKLIPRPKNPLSTYILMMYSFAGLIVLGTLLLILPFSSASGSFTSPIDALFSATSATCVTGLEVVDTGTHWSLFGQAVLMVLFQIGGLGFIVGATLLLIAMSGRFGLKERLMITETMGMDHLGGSLGIVVSIVTFSLILESAGAVIFYFHWVSEGGIEMPLFTAFFHAFSAFNNCGLDIFNDPQSLTMFRSDAVTMLTTAVLIIFGSAGFVVVADLIQNRSFVRLSLDSKIVLVTTLALIAIATLFYFAVEYGRTDTLGPLGFLDKVLVSFFHSVSLRTAGFSAFNVGSMTQICLFFTMIMMFIGGASASMAGGIKVNTLGLLAITFINLCRGRDNIVAFGRQISKQTIYTAIALLFSYTAVLGLLVLILSFTEPFHIDNLIFETLSALGTIGSSTGITSQLSAAGKTILVIAMFAGRLAPLAFIIYLTHHRQPVDLEYPHEHVRLG
ncbi:MAG: potassium transporter TrkG [Dehalococcoidales bacterium]|nr:potassium transporter TrkG [Dehalococcoidales bacterium]